MKRWLGMAWLAVALACGQEKQEGPPPQEPQQKPGVFITPASALVLPGEALQFKAFFLSGTDQPVRWSVREAGGGTVDTSGHYRAPEVEGTYRVLVASVADPAMWDEATVRVVRPVVEGMERVGAPIRRPDTSDVWGYTAPDGRRYGLMGTELGVLVLALDEALGPTVVDEVVGPRVGPLHRNIKTYRHYAYVSSERVGEREGILIIDLSGLPGPGRYVRSLQPHDGVPTSHNLSIDTARGHLYVQRQRAIEVWSLEPDPEAPRYVTSFATGVPVHDMMVQGSRCYVADGDASSFSIWDVSDMTQPTRLVTWPVTGFAHNIWPSADGTWVVTTEETPGKPVVLWSVSADPVPVVSRRGSFLTGPGAMAHNAYVENGRVYLSHYTSGVVVLDVRDLDAPVRLGQYDTSSRYEGGEINGCWGVYPFPGSNLVLGSDMEEGFHLLRLTAR
jgi:choice-of-anchor B domain-containing protein